MTMSFMLSVKPNLTNCVHDTDNAWSQPLQISCPSFGVFLLLFFFFDSVLLPFQDYSSSYETVQSVGGAKTGEPREKTPGTPASRTWLVSHVARVGLEPTPDTAVR